MTTAELLRAVIAQGIELRVSSGGELQVRDPERRLSGELRAQLLERRLAVLAALDPAEARRRKDHEKANHHDRPAPWWQTGHGNWECGICHPDPEEHPAERDASYVVAAPNGARAKADDDVIPLDPELLRRLDRLWTNERDLEKRSGVHRETIRAWRSGERTHGQRSKQEQLRAALHTIAEEERERHDRLYRPPQGGAALPGSCDRLACRARRLRVRVRGRRQAGDASWSRWPALEGRPPRRLRYAPVRADVVSAGAPALLVDNLRSALPAHPIAWGSGRTRLHRTRPAVCRPRRGGLPAGTGGTMSSLPDLFICMGCGEERSDLLVANDRGYFCTDCEGARLDLDVTKSSSEMRPDVTLTEVRSHLGAERHGECPAHGRWPIDATLHVLC